MFGAPPDTGDARSTIWGAYGVCTVLVDALMQLMLLRLFWSGSQHEASGGRSNDCDQHAEPQ